MVRKEEILLKLEEIDQLLVLLENRFEEELNKDRKELIGQVYHSQLLLENKIKKLENKCKIKKLSASINVKKHSYKLQRLG